MCVPDLRSLSPFTETFFLSHGRPSSPCTLPVCCVLISSSCKHFRHFSLELTLMTFSYPVTSLKTLWPSTVTF